ncbi:MAG: DUF2059 domain-containing protein [Chlorobiales bacterium]|nr:DUF2059 domain-containing protein [Chlorobiales bacterium]
MSMKRHLVMASILATIVCCPQGVLRADEASHRKAALELIETVNAKQLLDQMLTSMDRMMEQQFSSMGMTTEQLKEAAPVKREISAWMRSSMSWDSMRALYVDVYMEVFTEQELREIDEFYHTPLGRKMLVKMPELVQVSMQKTQAMMQEKMPELQQRISLAVERLRQKSSGGNR